MGFLQLEKHGRWFGSLMILNHIRLKLLEDFVESHIHSYIITFDVCQAFCQMHYNLTLYQQVQEQIWLKRCFPQICMSTLIWRKWDAVGLLNSKMKCIISIKECLLHLAHVFILTVRHDRPACLVLILCSPQFLCSSFSQYSSFSNPFAPGWVLHSYFVWRLTEIKGTLNMTFPVCCRIYIPTVTVYYY